MARCDSQTNRKVTDDTGWFYYMVVTLHKPLTACVTGVAPDERQQHRTCSSDKNIVNVWHVVLLRYMKSASCNILVFGGSHTTVSMVTINHFLGDITGLLR